jgi:hypothetical protein
MQGATGEEKKNIDLFLTEMGRTLRNSGLGSPEVGLP